MTLATPNSFLTLGNGAPTFTLPSGATTRVFGTAGADSITLSAGAAADLTGFNNPGDIVNIQSASTVFEVLRQGVTVTLRQGGVDILRISAGTSPVPINFSNGSANLRIDTVTGQVLLGTQVVNNVAAPVNLGGGPLFTTVDIGSQGTQQNPAILNAANGAFSFVDLVSVPSAVVINNFGSDDQIDFDNLNILSISNFGTTVNIAANNSGILSTISLPGVAGPTDLIFDLASFNALPVGDIV
jgi:hypothetical protein